jgi:hypothetical protein
MKFHASSLVALHWDLDKSDFAAWGEYEADIDDLTIEFDETSGNLTAKGHSGTAEGQAMNTPVAGNESVLIVRCEMEMKLTTWIIYGVSESAGESFRQAHSRWALMA